MICTHFAKTKIKLPKGHQIEDECKICPLRDSLGDCPFEFIMNLFGCAQCSGDIAWYEVVEDDGKLEVIGNIYENPELLETK